MNKDKLGKVGGQAVIEGVMMQSQDYRAIAVRKSDGEIEVKKERIKSWVKDKKIDKIPFLRGGFILIDTMISGMNSLNFSSSFFLDDEEEEDAIDKFLIRNPRCDNSDIHSALCSKAQSMRHFVGNDQIRCHKPTVFFCLVCHADIHFLAYLFIIHRNIRIRLHKSILLSLVVVLHEKLTEIRVIFIFLTDSIPHL